MLVKKMGKYYVVKVGNKPGIYNNWTDCEREIKGFKGAIYKSFKTLEEAEEFYNSEFDKAAYYKGDKEKKKADVERKKRVTSIPSDLDAIIYADGSFQKKYDEQDAYCGSYGILLFSRNGIYVESTLIYDPSNQNETSFIDENGNGYFIEERRVFKEGHFVKQEKSEVRFLVSNTENKDNFGIAHTGLSQASEFIGAGRAIDICMKLKYKKVMLVYDSMTIVQSYNKYEKKSESASSNYFKMKVKEAKNQGMDIVIDEYTKVDSHKNGEEKVKNPSLIDNYFGIDDYVYNDVVDILAKVQILKQPIFTVGWNNDEDEIVSIKNENLALSNRISETIDSDLSGELRDMAKRVIEENNCNDSLKETYIEWAERLINNILPMDSKVKKYFNLK